MKISYPKMSTELISYWSIEKNSNNKSHLKSKSEQDYIDDCNTFLKKNIVKLKLRLKT